ncbi:efflux RND transporter permease subunit [Leadbettera azotonutricia]|uniref:Putative AcrB family membrane transport protein n=1 Tax=Leadbettera azotonutricia (strain ATCC BAA-888 / DSM 13862 / ZAS-9) TaxID=545695 RepID=F5Y6N4_LEAAZ|nr:efflux RND transporter permease subunit [Leadbettera azotonutricia]AEF82952.1 putative AcrB family membrane transport protein [Leadbettera azotonutricia ZAS-9]
MKTLIDLCVRRPVTMIMIMAAIFLGGIVSLFNLPLEKLPEIRLPRVTVEAVYPGMGAAELRNMVTIPLEDALSPVKGLETMKSVSRNGASLVSLGFRWGTDPASAAALVREAIDAVYPSLPEGVKKPTVTSGDPDEEPQAIIAIRSKDGDKVFARNLAEYELRARFRRLDGAGAVILAGGETEEIRIAFDQERLVSMGINGNELAELIAYETADIPGGNAREGDKELTVISSGRPKSMEELSTLVIPSGIGPLHLKDIAKTYRTQAPGKSLFIFNNEDATALEIYRRPGSDPIKLSRDIKKALEAASKDFSRDTELSLAYDLSSSILENVLNLIVSIILAVAIVALILAVFMNNLRSSVLSALAIPFSAASALILLNLGGHSLNSMSLGGMALGIGLVSDTSIIVLDLLDSNKEKLKRETIAALAASVSGSSLGGTVTTVIVFIPIIFLPGPLGALFGDLAISLIASVTMGWVYAQFFLPSFFLLFPVSKTGKSSIIKKPETLYLPFLKLAIQRPLPLIIGTILFSIFGFFLLFARPGEFIASDTVKEIEVTVEFPSGTMPKAASEKGILVSQVLSSLDNTIENFFGKMGAEDEDSGPRADPDYRDSRLLFRCFLCKGIAPDKALKEIDDAVSSINTIDTVITASYPEEKTAKILGLSSSFGMAIKGNGREDVIASAESAERILKNSAAQYLNVLTLRPSGTRPELRLIPNREAAAFLGVSNAKMASSVYAASEGIVTGIMELDGRTLDMRSAASPGWYSPEQIEKLPLVLHASGREIPNTVFLSALNKIERKEADVALARQDRSDVIYLDLLPAAGKENALRAFIKTLPLEISRADESVFEKYYFSLVLTVVLVVLLLYLALAAQFESFFLPLILMLAIPFSLVGAGPLLFICGSGLDSGSVLGLIVLFGLAVNNGIVLYEVGEEKTRLGLAPVQAVFKGALERFRPVLITTLTTIFALLPLIFSPGSSQRSMSAAMLGGITASALLSFFALPPIIISFLKKKNNADKLQEIDNG